MQSAGRRRAEELNNLMEARADFKKESNVPEWKIPPTFASLPLATAKCPRKKGVCRVRAENVIRS